MPINQSLELYSAYKRVNAYVQFEVVPGGAAFYDAERMAIVKKFLRRNF